MRLHSGRTQIEEKEMGRKNDFIYSEANENLTHDLERSRSSDKHLSKTINQADITGFVINQLDKYQRLAKASKLRYAGCDDRSSAGLRITLLHRKYFDTRNKSQLRLRLSIITGGCITSRVVQVRSTHISILIERQPCQTM